ncbi:MAG: restriction endonuclease subunit S [Verrucomicrobiota bacterium JB023]|nr:restriction endonuclease subunit S [Verrucomicrobiota bacterium JB023]
MELKEGYKQTEVGVIPDDWEVAEVGQTCSHVTTGKLDANAMDENGAYRFYTCAKDYYRIDTYAFDCEALLISGNGAHVGYIHYYAGKFNAYQRTYVLSGFKSAIKFVQHYLDENFRRRIQVEVKAGGTPYITRDTITESLLPLPPTKAEQEAIAEALSDADALIESLEQLIAKKRQIKQGAMQQLLTGKKRLPGFSEEWEVKTLGNLAIIRSGGTPSTSQPQFWDGDIPWCTPTDITALSGSKHLGETIRKITQAGLASSSAELLPANSVIMTSRATIGECAINLRPVSTNQGFKNFIPFDETDVEFLFYLLATQKQGFIGLCAGSTFLEIGKTQLIGYEVTVPPEKTEQTAIATILSDMDAEIAALESKLAKARQIKQGMMQELLTGKTRLI